MMVLVTYDVSTQDAAGARRLRQVAKACLNYVMAMQFAVAPRVGAWVETLFTPSGLNRRPGRAPRGRVG